MKAVYTTKASQDVSGIIAFTKKTFGKAQAKAYHSKIKKAKASIEENPRIGIENKLDDISCYALLVGKHFLCYRISEEKKLIVIFAVIPQKGLPKNFIK